MAWVMEDRRCCPSCGSSERVLVVQGREGGFRLSCSWCAFLSERMDAQETFFVAWSDREYPVGYMMDLEGVPHWRGVEYVESVPIRVINNGMSALVVERKEVA